jgi:hypothetical protein
MVRSLIGFCLICLLVGFGATSILAKGQPISGISGIKVSTYNSSAWADSFPVMPLAPVIPGVITTGEIAMREQQIQILTEFESTLKLKLQAGTGINEDVFAVKYFRLTNEIQLVQAKQLLRLKQQTDNSSGK